jgi:Fe-S cluster assembly protein SufD
MGSTALADTLPTTSDRSAFMTNGPDFGSHPEYFTQRQRTAWERFQSLPAPTRKEETWRFTDTKQVSLAGYGHAEPVSDAEQATLLTRSSGLPETAGRMVFANDRLLGRHFHGESLRAKGVLWLPLEQAITEQRELIERHFMREDAILGSAKFAALHQSQVRAGMFLYVPKNVEIALPVETFHWLSGENSSVFPHTLIIAEDNSKVTVLDHFESAADAPGLAIGVNDIVVGAGAKVTYVAIQNWSRQTLAFHLNNTVVDRDASALALTLNLGGSFVRGEALSHLRGPGGRSDMLSVSAAEDSQIFDQRTLQIHEVPNTASDLLYKNALNDTARTIFTGLIRVDEGAHQTDAYQKVRNLILSDEAEANSAPGLEIEADDVRCTHGATSGTLEEEELFYFQSRGIPRRFAQQLITFGFLNEVFDRLPDHAIQEKLREALHGKLG